jgi:hypothetical protein
MGPPPLPATEDGSQRTLQRSDSISHMSEDSQTAQECVLPLSQPSLPLTSYPVSFAAKNSSNSMPARHFPTNSIRARNRWDRSDSFCSRVSRAILRLKTRRSHTRRQVYVTAVAYHVMGSTRWLSCSTREILNATVALRDCRQTRHAL